MNRADQRSSAADGLLAPEAIPDELLVVHPQITQITQNHLQRIAGAFPHGLWQSHLA